ncbi:aldehyde dehydrogenase family protein [Streptomyces phyllanthi]|uniref:Aldehyde dehydrogenase family protein n=1 Tax=Streptomyces phyllanthi TaxID=1803180 RepID=A0A5N8VW62_9ACTN|nr:aldehyde dehydrogenase family protein [Streptomyces phyllanthi]
MGEAAAGTRFDDVNAATEEVLGQAADGGREDMERAIAAARRAFGEPDWSTGKELYKRALAQLQVALEEERGRELPDSNTFGLCSRRKVVKEAQGVVGAITPWNVPVEIITGRRSARWRRAAARRLVPSRRSFFVAGAEAYA